MLQFRPEFLLFDQTEQDPNPSRIQTGPESGSGQIRVLFNFSKSISKLYLNLKNFFFYFITGCFYFIHAINNCLRFFIQHFDHMIKMNSKIYLSIQEVLCNPNFFRSRNLSSDYREIHTWASIRDANIFIIFFIRTKIRIITVRITENFLYSMN